MHSFGLLFVVQKPRAHQHIQNHKVLLNAPAMNVLDRFCVWLYIHFYHGVNFHRNGLHFSFFCFIHTKFHFGSHLRNGKVLSIDTHTHTNALLLKPKINSKTNRRLKFVYFPANRRQFNCAQPRMKDKQPINWNRQQQWNWRLKSCYVSTTINMTIEAPLFTHFCAPHLFVRQKNAIFRTCSMCSGLATV